MYKKRLRKWRFFKNNKKNAPDLLVPTSKSGILRTRRQTKVSKKSVLGIELAQRLQPQLVMGHLVNPQSHRTQEKILSDVQNYIHGLFESHGWRFDRIKIMPPSQAADRSREWQCLSDSFFGVFTLISNKSIDKGFARLRDTFLRLESATDVGDISIMIKFWRICYYLRKICLVSNDYTLIYTFLSHLKALIERNLGSTYPLVHLLASLHGLDRDVLFDSLRIGYLRAIRCLDTILGSGHPLVLSTWTNYLKHWDGRVVHSRVLEVNYRRLLEVTNEVVGLDSEQYVSALHSFAYTACYIMKDETLGGELVSMLHKRSRMLLQRTTELRWGMETQAFAFASKIMAQFVFGKGQRQLSWDYMISAIGLLERGDQECQIRAIMLAQDMSKLV